jgi:hypothetical protein
MQNYGGMITIKKIVLMLLVLFAVSGLSFAAVHEPGTGIVSQENNTMAPQGIHEPGTGLTNPEVKEAAQGTGQGLEARAENATNESAASAPQAQPGFEAALAMFGIIVASFGLLCRRH